MGLAPQHCRCNAGFCKRPGVSAPGRSSYPLRPELPATSQAAPDTNTAFSSNASGCCEDVSP